MAFNPEIVKKRLLQLADYLEFLKSFEDRSVEEFSADRMIYGAGERFAQLAMECIADTCTYILVRHFKGVAKGYSLTIAELGERNLFSAALAGQLQKMMQFRNILVHNYVALDRHLVFEHIKAIVNDGHEFLDAVARWIEEQQ